MCPSPPTPPSRRASRRLLKAFLAGALLLCPAAAAHAQSALRVGLYQNHPKISCDDEGRPQGIFVDILQAIADAEHWSLTYVPGTWPECLARLAAGDLDLMPDVALTPERELRFRFHSEPVLSSWFHVYAHRGSNIRSLVDFDGKKVAFLDDSIQLDAFRRMLHGFDLETHLVAYPDYDSAFLAVSSGKMDAVVANRFYDTARLRDNNIENTAIIFNPTRLFFAAPPNASTDFLATLDRHLRQMKQDRSSAYYQTLRRWTADDPQSPLPRWLLILAAAAAGLFLLIGAWNLSLNRRVADRTTELQHRNEENLRLYNTLRLHAESLEKRIAEHTDELIIANGALLEAKELAESADRIKSAFLATMSHELRTPLNSIIGFAGILLQQLPGPLNPEQNKQINIIRDSSHHLLELINDVLDISKIEAGQLDIIRQPFDLRESIARSTDIARPLALKKNLDLNVRIAPDIGAWTGDARRVEQILINLLNNAIKFTDTGAVSLDARFRGNSLELEVADSGIGIPAEALDSIFQPFRQLDAGLTRQHDGSGLGLAICHRLAQLMNGAVRVESTPGKGSRFTVAIPRET